MDPSNQESTPTRVRLFANFLRVGFNRQEFLLDFAQAHEGQAEHVSASLVAAPAHVKQFAVLMQGCVSDYEQRYGVIRLDRGD